MEVSIERNKPSARFQNKKQFLVKCLNQTCGNAFAEITIQKGTAGFRVSTFLTSIPMGGVVNNSSPIETNELFHYNDVCYWPNIGANESQSCDVVNFTSISHFYVEISNKEYGDENKVESSLKLINIYNITEGSK